MVPVEGSGRDIVEGVVIDRCPTSKGIWFDSNELETLLEKAKAPEVGNESWVHTFFKAIGYK